MESSEQKTESYERRNTINDVLPNRKSFGKNVQMLASFSFPPLAKVQKDSKEKKSVNFYLTNESGKVESGIDFDSLSKLTANKMKIWAIGSYKAGKSTILNLLSKGEYFKSSEVINTKGVEYLVANEAVYIDTEGFNQPINSEEPYVKRDFIINHMRSWSDIVLLLVDRILDHELIMLDKLIEFTAIKQNLCLIVIHNVKSIEDTQTMLNYVEKTKQGFGDLSRKVDEIIVSSSQKLSDVDSRIHRSESYEVVNTLSDFAYTQLYKNNRRIHHVFIGRLTGGLLGKINEKKWKSSFETLQRFIQNPNGIDPSQKYISSMEKSIKVVLSKYFDLNDDHIKLGVVQNPMTLIVPPADRVDQSTSTSFLNQSRLHFDWAKYDDYLCMFIHAYEFELTEVKIKDADLIFLKGFFRDYTGKDTIYIESVCLPVPVIAREQTAGDIIIPPSKILGINNRGSWAVVLRLVNTKNNGIFDINPEIITQFEMPKPRIFSKEQIVYKLRNT